ncbi:hypothetical protein Tco_1556921 [Tanacetum coccineum]
MRGVASAYYHSLHLSGTPSLLPISPPAPSTCLERKIPEGCDTPPRKRLLLTTPRPGCEIGESSAAAAARQPVDVSTRENTEFCTRHHDAQKDRTAVRAEIEGIEARVTVLETEARRHEWQRQAADDLTVQHIMRTQALETGARVDTLEDTGRALC